MPVMKGLPAGSHPPVKASVNTSFAFGTTSRKMPGLGISCPSGDCIVMLLEPPARTSITARIVLYGGGVNHCTISSGSVQQRQSFSRGAFSTRSRTSSRSAGKEEDGEDMAMGRVELNWFPVLQRTGRHQADTGNAFFVTGPILQCCAD